MKGKTLAKVGGEISPALMDNEALMTLIGEGDKGARKRMGRVGKKVLSVYMFIIHLILTIPLRNVPRSPDRSNDV